jgi:restriction system protein
MSRRRSSSPLEDLFDLLATIFRFVPPWVSIPVAIVGFLVIVSLSPRLNGPLAPVNGVIALFGVIFGGIFALVCLAAGFKGWQMRRRQQAFLTEHVDIGWLNRLSWQSFEHQVAEVYRQQGYSVEETGGGGSDGGVDLILYREGQKTVVQCKRWKTYKVGVKPVRELFGVMTAEGADRAIFITSGIYTNEALQFAEGKPLELVDGAQFAVMLRQFQKNLGHALGGPAAVGMATSPVEIQTPDRPECPICGSPMVLRRAKRGANAGNEFWGCSKFPSCRGIRNLN